MTAGGGLIRVGLDIRKSRERTGVGIVTRNLAKYLMMEPGFDFRIMKPKSSSGLGIPLFSELFWKQIVLPRDLQSNQIQVALYTYPILPIFSPTRSVIIIYDMLSAERFERSPLNFAVFTMLKLTSARSTRIITISEYSKTNIMRFLRQESNRVVVAYPGHEHMLEEPRINARYVSQELLWPGKYLLSVPGSFSQRKNAPMLVEAYSLLPKAIRKTHKLVLVARRDGPDWARVRERIRELSLGENISIQERVTRSELRNLYEHAEVLLHPTLYDGFGMPVLEAMSLGTPVIASNTASLPEIVGDAGRLTDPRDSSLLADVILGLIQDEEQRRHFQVLGPIQAQFFSWKTMAQTVANVLGEAAN